MASELSRFIEVRHVHAAGRGARWQRVLGDHAHDPPSLSAEHTGSGQCSAGLLHNGAVAWLRRAERPWGRRTASLGGVIRRPGPEPTRRTCGGSDMPCREEGSWFQLLRQRASKQFRCHAAAAAAATARPLQALQGSALSRPSLPTHCRMS